MKNITWLYLILLTLPSTVLGQSVRKPISGKVYTPQGDSINITYSGKERISLDSDNEDYNCFFSSIVLCKTGRKQLKHLLQTESQVTIDINSKICITYQDSSYRIAAGLTGVETDQSSRLIMEYYQPKGKRKDINLVYEQNTVIIYSGCLDYIKNPSMRLDKNNVVLFDLSKNQFIDDFDLDTINIEPFMHPELLYQNEIELYCFVGIHEIEHLKAENILVKINGGSVEASAMKIELKAFKRRKRINIKGRCY